MAGNNIFGKLERVRKPRVHIKYDVYKGDAVEKQELPFVVGVMGDFSGTPTEPLKSLVHRKFVEINRDNFDEIMAKMTPGVNLRVQNTMKGDGSEMAVNLKFNSMADFEPAEIARQVEPLRKLLETRDKLRDLLSRVDRYDDLEAVLEEVLKKAEEAKKGGKA